MTKLSTTLVPVLIFAAQLAVGGCTPSDAEQRPSKDSDCCAGSAQAGADNALFSAPVNTLDGSPSSLGDHAGKALLIVNVASRCGLTPQYGDLEQLQERYADKGFSVLGFPCNQFGGQEPGTAEEIKTFCAVNYGISFPMFEKIEVNGEGRHPIYSELVKTADASGHTGDIRWNFEKFVVSADGETVTRFAPRTAPDAPEVIAAIEAGLPSE